MRINIYVYKLDKNSVNTQKQQFENGIPVSIFVYTTA